MLPEISLNILDLAQNSIVANATEIKITVHEDTSQNKLCVTIEDNGCGMSEEQLASVVDPFYTTRTTRKVGLGVPFFKEEAEMTGGSFEIESKPGEGTRTFACFKTDSIDCMPLGDINSTIHSLITMNENLDFIYDYSKDDKGFVLNTFEMREILGPVPFSAPEVAAFIKEFLEENSKELNI